MPTYFASGECPRYDDTGFRAGEAAGLSSPQAPKKSQVRESRSICALSRNRVDALQEPHVLVTIEPGLVPAFFEAAFFEAGFLEEGKARFVSGIHMGIDLPEVQ